MKKVFCFIFLLLIFSFVSNSKAINLEGKLALTTSAGLTLPLGNFSDLYNQGFCSGIEFEFFISEFSTGFHFNYETFTLSDKVPYLQYDPYKNSKILGYGFFVRYNKPTEGVSVPYITFNFNINSLKCYNDEARMGFGIGAGFGYRFLVGEKILLGAEGKFHLADIKYIPDLMYIALYGKLSYLFGED